MDHLTSSSCIVHAQGRTHMESTNHWTHLQSIIMIQMTIKEWYTQQDMVFDCIHVHVCGKCSVKRNMENRITLQQ